MLIEPMIERKEHLSRTSYRSALSVGLETPQGVTYKKPNFSVLRPDQTYISVEQAMMYVGDNSTYSKRIIFLMSVMWMPYAFLVTGISLFLDVNASFYCMDGLTGTNQPCDKQAACASGREIVLKPDKTIVNEFKLICNKAYLIAWISSTIYFTLVMSNTVFPVLSDRYGRKDTLMIALLVASALLIVSTFCHQFSLWMVCISLAGFCFGGVETVGRVYLSEISGPNFRVNSNAILSVVWASSQIILGFIITFFQNWRAIFAFIMGAPGVAVAIVGVFLLDESPIYLSTMVGHVKESKRVLKKMTITNKRPPFRFNLVSELTKKNSEYVSKDKNSLFNPREKNKKKPGLTILESLVPQLWLLTLWAVYYFAYFGLQFSIGTFGDAAVSFTYNGVAELLGVVAGAQIIKKFGKKPLMKWQISIAACASLSIFWLGDQMALTAFLVFRSLTSRQT